MSDTNLASDICISCQLCCNGVFFPSVSISAAESARLEQHSPGLCGGSTTNLPQPCSALSRFDGCTVYHLRPRSCAKFTCSVLHRAQTGMITPEKAEQLIERAKELKITADHASGDEAKLAKHALRKLVSTQFLRR